jgi:hypothetical protein
LYLCLEKETPMTSCATCEAIAQKQGLALRPDGHVWIRSLRGSALGCSPVLPVLDQRRPSVSVVEALRLAGGAL